MNRYKKICNRVWSSTVDYPSETWAEIAANKLKETYKKAHVYVESDEMFDWYNVYIRFNNDADEAEFLIKESL